MPKTLGPDELEGLQAAIDDYSALLIELGEHPGKEFYESDVTKLNAVQSQLARNYEALLFAQERALESLALKATRNLGGLLETIKGLLHDHITIMQKPDGHIIVTSAKGDYDVEMVVTRAFTGLLCTVMTAQTGEGYQVNIRLIPNHDEPLPFSPLDESKTR